MAEDIGIAHIAVLIMVDIGIALIIDFIMVMVVQITIDIGFNNTLKYLPYLNEGLAKNKN
jgi:hypothetical protein